MELLTIVSTVLAIVSAVLSFVNYRKTKKDFKLMVNQINCKIQINNEPIERQFMLDVLNRSPENILEEVSQYVLRYFKGICSDNHYVVRIFKIVDSEVAEPVYSSEQDSNSQQFRIRNNTSFSEVISTKKPYFINDIGYFLNQGRNHDKQFFTEDRNAIYQYQSIVCFPIGNNPIKGYLLVEIQKPLNDLIDINMISDFLNKVCDKINHSWQL